MKELVMSRDELAILTNELCSFDGGRFAITYPFYGEELLKVDTHGPRLTDIIDGRRMDACSRDMKPNGIDERHMINSRDLRNCLVMSGMVRFRNEDEIVGWLRELKTQSKDPAVRSKPVLVAVDTNILYFSFISRHLAFRDSDGLPFHSGFRYAVSDIVRDEIGSAVQYKYSNKDIEAFRSTFRRKDLLKEFKNGSDVKARKAKLALNECEFLRRGLKAAVTSGQGTRNKEQNDREIARSYMRHARDTNCDMFLLTADEDMVTHAKTCDVATKQLLVHTDVPKDCAANPWSVKDLLHDLAVTMGVISIEGDETIVLLGEWRGKTSDDYSDEKVKVVFEGVEEDRYARIMKELGTCREICQTCKIGMAGHFSESPRGG